MPSYPSALWTPPTINDARQATPAQHAQDHSDVNAEVAAIESELGTNPRGTAASVRARLDNVDAAVNSKATDTLVVHLAGAETITGAKTLTAELGALDFKVSGLTGATAGGRLVGATTSGAPTSGTFALGDMVIAQNGYVWVCVTAGTPGSWAQVGAVTSVNGATGAVTGLLAAAQNLAELTSVPTARTNLGLGTAATRDVAASGNAASAQVVKGDDSRLTDARTPTGHHATHEPGGSDEEFRPADRAFCRGAYR